MYSDPFVYFFDRHYKKTERHVEKKIVIIAFRLFSYSTSWLIEQSKWIQGSEDSVLIDKSKSIIVNEMVKWRMNSSPV